MSSGSHLQDEGSLVDQASEPGKPLLDKGEADRTREQQTIGGFYGVTGWNVTIEMKDFTTISILV